MSSKIDYQSNAILMMLLLPLVGGVAEEAQRKREKGKGFGEGKTCGENANRRRTVGKVGGTGGEGGARGAVGPTARH